MKTQATNNIKVEMTVNAPGCVLGIMDEIADTVERAMTHNKNLRYTCSIEKVEEPEDPGVLSSAFTKDFYPKTYKVNMEVEAQEETMTKTWLDDCFEKKGGLK